MKRTTAAAPTFNQSVLAAAELVTDAIRADVMGRAGRNEAVVAVAPAGAGKSYFVALMAGLLFSRGLRIAVAAPTNLQAQSLLENVTDLNRGIPAAFVHAAQKELPPALAARPGVSQPDAASAQASAHPLVIATVDKLADAHLRSGLGGFDVLLLDEAYQLDAGRYYTAAHVGATHLLVGDSGQLDPFSTFPEAEQWRGGNEDPLQTAVGVLLRNHPETPVHRMPVTRRLDPRAVPMARQFYPGHHFEAAVLDDVRGMRFERAGSGRRALAAIDRAIDEAGDGGWAHLVLPAASVLSADLTTAELIRDLVLRLFNRQAKAKCERRRTPVLLEQTDVAVGVSHNDQKDLVRTLLDSAGLGRVAVDTANRLQGLTYELVVAWHPLAGAEDVDGFHLDPGRLCVLLTRHRQACIVVGRETDRNLLDGIPPATPGYLGWDPDPVLDGWEAHDGVFRVLERHTVRV